MPQPRNWDDKNTTVALGLLLFGISGLVSAIWTANAVAHGDLLTAAITAGGTVLALGICASTAVTRFKTIRLRGDSSRFGTRLRPDPVATAIICVTLAVVAPAGALYVIYVPRGDVDLPLSRGEQAFTPVMVGFLTALAAGGLLAYTLRGPGYFLMSPDGFEIRELLSTKRGLWSDVVDVSDTSPTAKARHPIVLFMRDGNTHVVQGASGYAPNGAALYWMVRHYWKHPESRAELIDGHALERLRSEQFTPE